MPFEVKTESDLDTDGAALNSGKRFEALDAGRYRLHLPVVGVVLEVDRLRRDRHELVGELAVYANSRPFSIADFNLSSARARQERAKLLRERRQTEGDVDWATILEDFCQYVLAADRVGQPAVDLRTLPRPTVDDTLEIDGLALPRRHPSILFGDGGAAKSYLALYFIGRLAQQGKRVALFDWELAGEDHRERLELLFGNAMPKIIYARCDRPLVYEVDRLRRIVRDEEIEFLVYDSVAFACDGPPEAAEIAGRYFRAVREIGVGSLHIAHINKGDNSDQKPFGSAFWHNGARSTWFAKASEPVTTDKGTTTTVGLFNRKVNLGRLRSPFGLKVTFTDERTKFARTDVRDCPDMTDSMNVRQRMAGRLRRGAMKPEDLAAEIDAKEETITRTARRYKEQFVFLDDGRLALCHRENS